MLHEHVKVGSGSSQQLSSYSCHLYVSRPSICWGKTWFAGWCLCHIHAALTVVHLQCEMSTCYQEQDIAMQHESSQMTQSTTKCWSKQWRLTIANAGQHSHWICHGSFILHNLLKCTSSTPQMLIKLSFFLEILFFCYSFSIYSKPWNLNLHP